MDTQGSDGVPPSHNLCTIYSGLASAKGFYTTCLVACCSKPKFVQKLCVKRLFTATNPGKVFDLPWIKDSNSEILCRECKVQCFFCNNKDHHFKNAGVMFGRCNTPLCTKWCYYIRGCLNKGQLSKRPVTKDDYMCSECSTKRVNVLEYLP